MIKVLFVCLGNICRSPLAEALFKHKVKETDLVHLFEIDSCGTGDYHIGSQPDHRTIKVANKHGVEIFHACRQLTENDLDYFDYLLAMDNSNYRNILRLSKQNKHEHKIKLMREFDSHQPGSEVPDPYHGGDREFQEVFNILDRSLDGFISHVKAQHSL
jgi:protein-tyrosine phosphatase